MSFDRGQYDKFEKLRQRAEELMLKTPEAEQEKDYEVTELIHELKIHQGELELQNEELKKSQLELSALHQKYEYFYEFAPCGYLTLDSRGVIQQINLTGTVILGINRNHITPNTNFSNYLANGWKDAFRELLINFEKQYAELKLANKGGDSKWIKVEIEPIQTIADPDPIETWQMTITDITERKQAEKNTRHKENHLQSILESQNELVVTIDLEYRLNYVNQAYCKFFDKTREELLGQPFLPLAHERDIDKTFKYVQSFYKPAYQRNLEQWAITANGWRWIAWEYSRIRDENGEVVEILAEGRDITAQKMAEEALRRSEKYYRSIFETSGSAMLIIEEDTTISLANTYFEELSGYSRQELGGKKSWTEFIHPEDVEWIKENHLLQSDHSAVSLNYELRFFNRDNEMRYCYLTIDLIPETKQNVISFVDITEYKQVK